MTRNEIHHHNSKSSRHKKKKKKDKKEKKNYSSDDSDDRTSRKKVKKSVESDEEVDMEEIARQLLEEEKRDNPTKLSSFQFQKLLNSTYSDDELEQTDMSTKCTKSTRDEVYNTSSIEVDSEVSVSVTQLDGINCNKSAAAILRERLKNKSKQTTAGTSL